MGVRTIAAAALAGLSTVSAHGHVSNIVVNGVYYAGLDPSSYPYQQVHPPLPAWYANDPINDFITPAQLQTPDIICHRDATPGTAHVTVNAGDKISLQWVPIPWPHVSTIIDYLAPCNGPCENVNKTTLEWFKIDNAAWVSGSNPGKWLSDTLIADNSTWLVQIPPTIAPGNYVLRHELIALHSAQSPNGAQFYPQCFNLEIKGTGTLQPSGVLGTALYKATDPGILFNLYTSISTYIMPGPTLNAAFPSYVAQSSSKATATATPTVGAAKRGITEAPKAMAYAA